MADGTKERTAIRCSKCGEEKSLDNFQRNKARAGGYGGYCKPCMATYRKENRTYSQLKQYAIKHRFGLTMEQLDAMFEAANSKCEICSTAITLNTDDKEMKAHIDHCHTSGVVRGLLCRSCNTGLGMFRDNTHFLDKAKSYLQRTANV